MKSTNHETPHCVIFSSSYFLLAQNEVAEDRERSDNKFVPYLYWDKQPNPTQSCQYLTSSVLKMEAVCSSKTIVFYFKVHTALQHRRTKSTCSSPWQHQISLILPGLQTLILWSFGTTQLSTKSFCTVYGALHHAVYETALVPFHVWYLTQMAGF
jgi:hypothetical protein